MKHPETFGDRVRFLRKKLSYTQKSLSEKVEIPKSTLAGYENNIRKPKFETLEKLAEVLNTSADYLIGMTDDPQPSRPTKDLKKLLQASDYHINGKKLSNENLEFVIQFIEKLAKNDNIDKDDIEISEELTNSEDKELNLKDN